MTGADDDCSLGGAFERQIGRSCGIAHILGILLMNSCNTVIFLEPTIICSLSTLNRVGHLNTILALGLWPGRGALEFRVDRRITTDIEPRPK